MCDHLSLPVKTKNKEAITKEILVINWASTRENLSSGFANNTGADQPAHPRRLVSAYVIRLVVIISVYSLQFLAV